MKLRQRGEHAILNLLIEVLLLVSRKLLLMSVRGNDLLLYHRLYLCLALLFCCDHDCTLFQSLHFRAQRLQV